MGPVQPPGGGGERGVGRICVSPFFVWDLFPELGP
jgi:hypothetical protein